MTETGVRMSWILVAAVFLSGLSLGLSVGLWLARSPSGLYNPDGKGWRIAVGGHDVGKVPQPVMRYYSCDGPLLLPDPSPKEAPDAD